MPAFPPRPLTPALSPAPAPAPLYFPQSDEAGASGHSHFSAQQQLYEQHFYAQQPGDQHLRHSKTRNEKNRAKKKAKKQRRADRKKALYAAAAKAKADDQGTELASAMQHLDIESRGKGKAKCRADGTGVATPPSSPPGNAAGENFEEDSEACESEASDSEDTECKPYTEAGLTCCAEHGKGCLRFPDLIAMKRYLPTWHELSTGEERRVLRKYSV